MSKLVPFRQFEPALDGLITRAHFLSLSRQNLAPKLIRLTQKGAALVDDEEMAGWLAERGLHYDLGEFE